MGGPRGTRVGQLRSDPPHCALGCVESLNWLLCAPRISRGSLESVCLVSKGYLVSPASPAPLGRRETSGDQAFRESMVLSAPQASRESEVGSSRQVWTAVGLGLLTWCPWSAC